MRSSDYRSKDQLDRLIEQALLDSVAGEEPPAHVWERIRARLTRADRRPSVRWTGLVLQGALLTFLLMLGGMSLWDAWSDQPSAVSSEASPTAPLTLSEVDTTQTFSEPVAPALDTEEIALLREYSSLQSRALIVAELRRRAPGVAVPAYDIPPHPITVQVQALNVEAPREVQPAGLPVDTPGTIWE